MPTREYIIDNFNLKNSNELLKCLDKIIEESKDLDYFKNKEENYINDFIDLIIFNIKEASLYK
jgi:hypothetical protein